MRELYFDYNATTPVHPRVRDAMLPYLTLHFGNPGSGHMWGVRARRAVEQARERVAHLISAEPEQIVFTSCATESNNLALKGFLLPVLESGGHATLAVSAVEHPAILEPARELADRGARLDVLAVDDKGRVPLAAAMAVLAEHSSGVPQRGLLSVMLANNETGVLNPVAELAELARAKGIAMHTDAAQAVAKIPVDVDVLGVDFLTIAGHKMYAPKGVGALYAREPETLTSLAGGGGQERGIRPGTENVAYLVGLGEACAMAGEDLREEESRQRGLGKKLLQGIASLGIAFRVHGDGAEMLPNVANVGFRGYMAGDILSGLVARDVGVSGGAACHSGKVGLSHVLEAMDVDMEYGAGAIRFSWGRLTTDRDVEDLVARLAEVFGEL